MNIPFKALSRRNLLVGLVLCGVGAAQNGTAFAEQEPIAAFVPKGSGSVTHERFDALLQAYVRRNAERYNRVDYRSLQRSGHAELKLYIAGLEEHDPVTLSATDALAYWINLYNAKTLDVVLSSYPIPSIREIKLGGGGFFTSGPWSKKIVRINGSDLSLDDIEHRIVRPIFGDPMSHYGLNCASYSCPNLLSRAYTGDTIASALQANAVDYINHRRGISISGNVIIASKIYSWYAGEFGRGLKLKEHWMKYAEPDLGVRIQRAKIGSFTYDWSLNDV